MSSFENVNPGISPLFLSQKIEQKLPEKNIPSTAAKAINLSANVPLSIHLNAQSAFFLTQSSVSIACKSVSFSFVSSTYVSINKEYVSEWIFSIAIWNP